MFGEISTTCHKAGRLLSGGDFKRKRLMVQVVRDAILLRHLGRHGSRHIVAVLHRGKPALRYLSLADSVTWRYNGAAAEISSIAIQEPLRDAARNKR